jgi:hypothetical protein
MDDHPQTGHDETGEPTGLVARFVDPPGVLECGPGWWGLLDELDTAIAVVASGYRVVQVKEKFGTLRFYWDPTSVDADARERVDALVQAAEARSAEVCEECGDPGGIVKRGWWRTFCPSCAAVA